MSPHVCVRFERGGYFVFLLGGGSILKFCASVVTLIDRAPLK